MVRKEVVLVGSWVFSVRQWTTQKIQKSTIKSSPPKGLKLHENKKICCQPVMNKWIKSKGCVREMNFLHKIAGSTYPSSF